MSQTSSTSSKHRRCKKSQILRPARNSLCDLLRRHANTSLFRPPVQWTDMHSHVLGAHFHELPPCDTPLPQNIPGTPPSKGHLRPSKTITTLSDALTEILHPDGACTDSYSNATRKSSIAVQTVLSTLWPAVFGQSLLFPELHIYFGDRVFTSAVHMQLMWLYPDDNVQSSQSSFRSISTRPAESNGLISGSAPAAHNPNGLPMICYIGRDQLATMRRSVFRVRPGPGRSQNEPVSRMYLLRSKAFMPANSNHDAYLVAIFLAMAQRHFYGALAPSSCRDSRWSPWVGKSRRPAFEDLKLRILTHDSDMAHFIIYTGHITSKFLDRFHDPFATPTSDGDEDDDDALGIRIEYTKVPIWPILGLKERLGKGLGEEVVGQFDPSEMETWNIDSDDDVPRNTKRKREALAHVFRFEEETDDDEQESSLRSKRQRLQEGPPIGVGA
ncbi:hypothetical protein J3459_015249 [Metarhizium acridum]|nr:hypothetical protein J3459_015249 [Metarhizium acridum]